MDSRTFSTKLVILCSLFCLISCSDDEKPIQNHPATTTSYQASHGGQFTDASIGDASNLIPMIAGDASSHAIAGQLYLALLEYDRNFKLVPKLAESWQVSKDKLSITFTIKPNLQWSDGTPFSAQDCLFTLQLMQDEHTQSPYKSDYNLVTSAEAPDAHTFIVHYKETFSPALASWAQLSILPQHIFKDEDIMDTKLSRQPKASIGPYFLEDWQNQQSIVLTANPDYFDGEVWINKRITRIIPDSATQFLELTAAHIDAMNLTPIQYKRLFDNNAQLKQNYTRYQYLGSGYSYLGFNLKRPPFDDILVRQAIDYAIDRQELVDGVLLGLGEAIATPYKPGTPWVNQNIKPRPFDPQKAKALLAQAGWVQQPGESFVSKNGKKFVFTIVTNNGNKQRADTATIIQQRLQTIGIKVHIRLIEWSAFIASFINTRNFDAVILGWSLNPEPDQYSIWHSSQTGERQFNFLSYSNAKVDEALEKARRIFDVPQRQAWYNIMQQEIHHDTPLIFLYAAYALPAVNRRIQGIKPAPAGIYHNQEKWFIPQALQRNAMQP
ncbi:MAG: peptide-binding protein [Mariprofundaceae bacterium]|nr:peptide-binding protein [Mariprofundaceae bacterium]